jgi:hypothetical protein
MFSFSRLVFRKQKIFQEYDWIIYLLVAGLAYVLGFWGYKLYFEGRGNQGALLDAAYYAFDLFRMKYIGHDPIPWQLNVARFLAPITTLLAALKVFLSLIYKKVAEITLPFWKNHAIVLGIDSVNKHFIYAMLDKGMQTVCIDNGNGATPHDELWEKGAIVLTRDLYDDSFFKNIGITKAQFFFAFTAEDEINLSILDLLAEFMAQAAPARSDPLKFFIRISDPYLQLLCRNNSVFAKGSDQFTARLVNFSQQAARLIIHQYPLEGAEYNKNPHTLLVSSGNVAINFLIRAAMTGQYPQGKKLQVTFCHPEATRLCGRLKVIFPGLEELLRLKIIDNHPETLTPRDWLALQDASEFTSIYVAQERDVDAVSIAQSLAPVMPLSLMIVAILSQGAKLVNFFSPDILRHKNINIFSIINELGNWEAIVGESLDKLARAIHEDYCRNMGQRGETADTNPTLKSWDRLEESLKEANRNQADHIPVKLRTIGCQIVSWEDREIDFTFSPREILLLEEMEHQRWVTDKIMSGWKCGLVKDPIKRLQPLLIPWDELSSAEKQKDRDAVLNIPNILKIVAKGIRRRVVT